MDPKIPKEEKQRILVEELTLSKVSIDDPTKMLKSALTSLNSIRNSSSTFCRKTMMCSLGLMRIYWV